MRRVPAFELELGDVLVTSTGHRLTVILCEREGDKMRLRLQLPASEARDRWRHQPFLVPLTTHFVKED